ncbi:hypothetical protein CAEBREN_11726 [Caenorhabditis brenneri]|uniref:INSulin related n=1 Tax=Caenorhabditis brenneri TaxID=135651 RepID=G0MJC4_CAEBE|nr:hypothetical protein CAEBREN_11726 [Caenorhabditis brenneri]
MSTKIFILLVLAIAIFASEADAKASLPQTCGKALVNRVQRICHGECTAPFEVDLAGQACVKGMTDEALKTICCP